MQRLRWCQQDCRGGAAPRHPCRRRPAAAAPMSPAKGLTTRLVPITISRSASLKSSGARSQNRSGRRSPKNTISGFTRPPHVWRGDGWVGAAPADQACQHAAVPSPSLHPCLLLRQRPAAEGPHPLLAVAGVAVCLEHRLTHVLHVVLHAALVGGGAAGRARVGRTCESCSTVPAASSAGALARLHQRAAPMPPAPLPTLRQHTLMQRHESKLPCAATTASAGRPAWCSSESMFCSKRQHAGDMPIV